MYWRPLREADLIRCLDMQPACLGDSIIGRDAALKIWRSLLGAPGFQGTVIEAEQPIAGQKVVGCGLGVFVAGSLADDAITDPKPNLNARILASIAAEEPVVLTREQIGEGNAGEGLDFVNLYGTWQDGIMTPDQLSEVHALLGASFAEHFAGYRFNRILKEAVGESRIALARATGTYRIVAEFPETESALAVVDRESALAAPYSVAVSIYRYQSPILRLRPAEQELLAAALSGKTDAELSSGLGLSIETTKKRWLSIFDRVDQFKPDILMQGPEKEGRGPQKRHRVVAYIRSHPEELRPFSWGPKRSTS